VEVMAAGMLRDSLYLINTGNGDDWRASFTAPTSSQVGWQASFQIPATNKGQLPQAMGTNPSAGPIIDLPWSNASANIISHINAVIAAQALLTRYQLKNILINSTNWVNIITNAQVRNTAGSANVPFAALDYDKRENFRGGPPMRVARIKGAPDVDFMMCDDAAALGGDTDPVNPSASTVSPATLQKYIPDTMAIFMPDPNDGEEWHKLYYGGELVAEYPGAPMMPRMGFYSWSMTTVEPTALFLYVLLNAIPALYVPNAVAPATIIY
jgi:hypothetical protein